MANSDYKLAHARNRFLRKQIRYSVDGETDDRTAIVKAVKRVDDIISLDIECFEDGDNNQETSANFKATIPADIAQLTYIFAFKNAGTTSSSRPGLGDHTYDAMIVTIDGNPASLHMSDNQRNQLHEAAQKAGLGIIFTYYVDNAETVSGDDDATVSNLYAATEPMKLAA